MRYTQIYPELQMLFRDSFLALIEKKFGHLLDQQYSQCPHCKRRIKASSEKVKREITTLIGSVVLYRPYF